MSGRPSACNWFHATLLVHTPVYTAQKTGTSVVALHSHTYIATINQYYVSTTSLKSAFDLRDPGFETGWLLPSDLVEVAGVSYVGDW